MNGKQSEADYPTILQENCVAALGVKGNFMFESAMHRLGLATTHCIPAWLLAHVDIPVLNSLYRTLLSPWIES